jgi:hypothetical protein
MYRSGVSVVILKLDIGDFSVKIGDFYAYFELQGKSALQFSRFSRFSGDSRRRAYA